MKAKKLREELREATIGLGKGWRVHRKAKDLESGEYAFIRNDGYCRGWRIVLNPENKYVALQQYNPGIDTKGCDCTIEDEFGFSVPNPNCPKCGGAWEIPVDYQTFAIEGYRDKDRRKRFNDILRDLYFYDIHPLMRIYKK